ncbi:MAG: hypothetical protein V3U54_13135 [Thermodesulfobacteriota bacterium]
MVALDFIEENTKEGIDFVIKDANDDSVVDITDTTITFFVFDEDFTTLLFSKACTITDAVNGKCNYTPASGDFSGGDGNFKSQLKIVFLDSTVVRIENLDINISRKAITS